MRSREHAACRDLDSDVFFCSDETSVAAAKRVCAHCAVRLHCLQDALHADPIEGVWGGLTEAERRRHAFTAH